MMTVLIPLCAVSALPEGEMTRTALPDGTALALYNAGGRIYATSDVCTHGEVSLSEEGNFSGVTVECGWHFGTFDVTTGEATGMPCVQALRTYPVTVIEGVIHVSP
jgi:p-cumate 2,3-dioxygenase ferredoxin subunit